MLPTAATPRVVEKPSTPSHMWSQRRTACWGHLPGRVHKLFPRGRGAVNSPSGQNVKFELIYVNASVLGEQQRGGSSWQKAHPCDLPSTKLRPQLEPCLLRCCQARSWGPPCLARAGCPVRRSPLAASPPKAQLLFGFGQLSGETQLLYFQKTTKQKPRPRRIPERKF